MNTETFDSPSFGLVIFCICSRSGKRRMRVSRAQENVGVSWGGHNFSTAGGRLFVRFGCRREEVCKEHVGIYEG